MINSNLAKYHKSVTNTLNSEPESTDTGTQDGKDAEEKEMKMYKNFYKYLTKWSYPHAVCIKSCHFFNIFVGNHNMHDTVDRKRCKIGYRMFV